MIYKYIVFIGLLFSNGIIYSQDTVRAPLYLSKIDSKDPSLEIQLVPLDQIIEIALANSPYLKFDSTMVSIKENDLKLQKRRWQTHVSAFTNISGARYNGK